LFQLEFQIERSFLHRPHPSRHTPERWNIKNKKSLFIVDEAHILRTEIDAHDQLKKIRKGY
jgi:hypothetical protein